MSIYLAGASGIFGQNRIISFNKNLDIKKILLVLDFKEGIYSYSFIGKGT